ncbi:PglZ domain-containing protein [Puteibacter caeruleilacunae]|nr:PglZ domain-containing protein [Puteibacter caeruleilacunae]
MKQVRILWVDDEIDLLKPHVIFLESKDFHVDTATNGHDAIELVKEQYFDIIFLDENMPGLTGLETLSEIKRIKDNIPVVMITKSEEEDIMDEAIGAKMTDYLIKPVNPKQILHTIKKNIDQKRLVSQQTTSAYQTEFAKIGMEINASYSFEEWKNIYKKLVYWELELVDSEDSAMKDVLQMQKNEANNEFVRFVKKNYLKWFQEDEDDRPMLSPDIFKQKVFPLLNKGQKVFVLIIDNLRFDHWRVLSGMFSEYFMIEDEDMYCSILPTATMYARNAIFAGMMPADIEKNYPQYWLNDDEEGGKNLKEIELFEKQLERKRMDVKFQFEKVTNLNSRKVSETIANISNNDLSIMVFNFVDMISHSRTEMDIIKELAGDERAYRSLIKSWFQHSSLYELIKELAQQRVKLILTTDHGTIRVNNAIKVIGERNTNTNLRYKVGRNLNYNPKEVFEVVKPKQAGLPTPSVSSSYIFAMKEDFFAYPNNYNYFSSYYKDSFQHGGISLEEMLIPVVKMTPKG